MKTRKFLGLIMAVIMSISWNPMQALASEEINVLQMHALPLSNLEVNSGEQNSDISLAASGPAISDFYVTLSFRDMGAYIEFLVRASQQAEEVGVKDIKIQKKSGILWTTVATSAGGGYNDASTYMGYIDYSNVESGKTYRVTCTFFAYIGGNDLTKPGTSAEVKCP